MDGTWIVLYDDGADSDGYATEAEARAAAHEACKAAECGYAMVYRAIAFIEAVGGADDETRTVCTNAE